MAHPVYASVVRSDISDLREWSESSIVNLSVVENDDLPELPDSPDFEILFPWHGRRGPDNHPLYQEWIYEGEAVRVWHHRGHTYSVHTGCVQNTDLMVSDGTLSPAQFAGIYGLSIVR